MILVSCQFQIDKLLAVWQSIRIIIVIYPEFQSAKQALWLVDSWSHAPVQIQMCLDWDIIVCRIQQHLISVWLLKLKLAWSSACAHVSLIDNNSEWSRCTVFVCLFLLYDCLRESFNKNIAKHFNNLWSLWKLVSFVFPLSPDVSLDFVLGNISIRENKTKCFPWDHKIIIHYKVYIIIIVLNLSRKIMLSIMLTLSWWTVSNMLDDLILVIH